MLWQLSLQALPFISLYRKNPARRPMARDRFAPFLKQGAPYRPKRLRRSRQHAPVSYETLSGLRGTWRTKLHLHELASRRSHIVGVARALWRDACFLGQRRRLCRGGSAGGRSRRRQGIETSRTSRGSIEDPALLALSLQSPARRWLKA